MTALRSGQSGITLIEILAALAVSALISLAGFTLLESVLQTEARVAGRLDRGAQQDRTFHLLALDLQTAHRFEVTSEGTLKLRQTGRAILWQAAPAGLERRILRPGQPDLVQRLLSDPAAFTVDRDQTALLRLRLPDGDLWRVFPLPSEVTP